MKTKRLLMLGLTLALVLAASAATALADSPVVPFKAFYNMSPQIVGVDENGCNIQKLPGVGKATHLGESTLYSDARGCPATSTQFGSLVFTADNGDQLFGDFSGQTELSFPNVRFYGNYQIFPTGTGRFEGVTGSGTYEGTANLILGKGTIEFNGTLVK